MNKRQFRVLFREFLFRMVDLELLSAQGDIGRLLGQFAALLLFIGSLFALACAGVGSARVPRAVMLVNAWGVEHLLVATTMLVVGLFAVLSWDSTFPDRRDVLVLAPLPIRARMLFLAKVAASGAALSLTVAALNALTGIVLPFALASANGGILDLVFSLNFYRPLAAYWITMMSAGAFIFGSVLGLEGIAAQLLPRRYFLRLSSLLQMAAFCLFVCVYFLEPSLASPDALMASENQRVLAWLPSYWFLGLFQQLNGSMHAAMVPLAARAWIGLAIAGLGTAAAYMLSYIRTLRRIAEEPDILPGSRGAGWLPRFGNRLETAVVQFSMRTVLRSRQHRVMLAFYLGIGFAIVILFMRTPRARENMTSADARLLFSSFVMMCVAVVGVRVVFSMPLALRANWIFRMTEVRAARDYSAAIRRPLFLLAVAPVWLVCAVLFLSLWPWRPAVGHLVILGLWGLLLAYLTLHGFQKIPFTCSYLPGKSMFHMAFLAALGLLLLLSRGVALESQALGDPARYAQVAIVLGGAVAVARWRTVAAGRSDGTIVQFEDVEAPAIMSLGLHRDGVFPG